MSEKSFAFCCLVGVKMYSGWKQDLSKSWVLKLSQMVGSDHLFQLSFWLNFSRILAATFPIACFTFPISFVCGSL